MSIMAYQSRPTATAWAVSAPSGCSSNVSIPSRRPNPPTEIGSTCAIATAGTYASTAAFGTVNPMVWTAQ